MQLIAKGQDHLLRKWDRAIKRLESASFARDLSSDLAKQTETLIGKSFKSARDPYGNPWASLKSGAKRKPLNKSKDLMKSFRTKRLSREGFTVGTPLFYGHIQHKGAPSINLPSRKQVASPGPLPPAWNKAFKRVARSHFRRGIRI